MPTGFRSNCRYLPIRGWGGKSLMPAPLSHAIKREISFQCTKQDLVRLLNISLRRRLLGWRNIRHLFISCICLMVLASLIVVGVNLFYGHPLLLGISKLIARLSIWLPVVVVAGIALCVFFFPPLLVRAEEYQMWLKPMQLGWDDNGFTLKSELSDAKINWQACRYYWDHADFVMLYITDKHLMFFPKRFFDADALIDFIATVKTRIKPLS